MLWALLPVLQILPVAAEEVSVTLFPLQMVADPETDMVGITGATGFTVTVTGLLTADVQVPVCTLTE